MLNNKLRSIMTSMIVLIVTISMCLSFSLIDVSAAATPARGKKPKMYEKSNTFITVTWAKSKNAKTYQLAYKKKGGSWKNYKKTTAKKLKVTSLKAKTTYYFRVRGINGKKYGKWSETSSAIKTYETPPAVKMIYVSYRSRNDIKVTWKNVAGIKSYDVSYVPVNGTGNIQTVPADKGDYTTFRYNVIIAPNTYVEFKVRSVVSHGQSGDAESSWITVYGNTITGKREVTATVHDDGTIAYVMEDTFTMGIDDALVPKGINITYDEHDDPYYYTDILDVNRFVVPNDSKFGDAQGWDISVGEAFKGKTVKKISLRPFTEEDSDNDEIEDGDKVLFVAFEDNTYFEYAW